MSVKPTKKQGKQQANMNRKLLSLAALVLLAGALALTYFYAKNNTTLFGSNTQTNQTTQTTAQPNTTQPNGTTTPIADRKFNIPELGITLTLPDGLEGLEYVAGSSEDKTTMGASFTTKSLASAKDATDYCKLGKAAIGRIVRFSKDPKTIPDSNAVTKEAINLSSYYYVYFEPQTPCAQSDETTNLQTKQADLLKLALKSAEILK